MCSGLVIQVNKSYSTVLLHCVQSLFGKEADKLEHANDDEKICILCSLLLRFCVLYCGYLGVLANMCCWMVSRIMYNTRTYSLNECK